MEIQEEFHVRQPHAYIGKDLSIYTSTTSSVNHGLWQMQLKSNLTGCRRENVAILLYDIGGKSRESMQIAGDNVLYHCYFIACMSSNLFVMLYCYTTIVLRTTTAVGQCTVRIEREKGQSRVFTTPHPRPPHNVATCTG
jgi:hypothetical protein